MIRITRVLYLFYKAIRMSLKIDNMDGFLAVGIGNIDS